MPFPRALLALAALAAVALMPSSAFAGHPPLQHEAQRTSVNLPNAPLSQLGLSQSLSADCVDGMAGPYPCRNVDMAGFVTLPQLGGAAGNDIWGWTDPATGREYAIMGTSNSTGFVDVTDPESPKLIGILPTRGIPDQVLWRDVKVIGHYAVTVAEVTDSGLQVFDLHRLRDAGPVPQIFDADATYDGFSSAHNIAVNEDTGFAYAVGTDILFGPNTCGNGDEVGGLHMIDMNDPLNPTFAGCALVEGDNNYVHDVECIVYDGPDTDYTGREICFGSNEDVVAIYDVTDKSNPQVLSLTGYPTAQYTHQGSLTEDRRYFLFGDELDEQNNGHNTHTYIMDVSDLDAPPTPVAYAHPSKSIDHNMYVHGDRVFQANYMEGLRILEFDDASLAAGQLNEVAYFDVVPGADVAEFAGAWSNYRFPGSGTVVVSAIENAVHGLFVLRPQLGDDPGPVDPPECVKNNGSDKGKGKKKGHCKEKKDK